MLVVSRKPGERILLSNGITITLIDVRPGRARVGIDAPGDVLIAREEIAPEELQSCSPLPAHSTRPSASAPTS